MRQGYDTVLREADREKGAFSELADYIWHNPVRAGLVEDWLRWPFLGCLLPGYPKLDPLLMIGCKQILLPGEASG